MTPLPVLRQKLAPLGFVGVIDPDEEVTMGNWEDDGGNACSGGGIDCAADVADDSDSTYVQNEEILMAFCGGSEEVRNIRFGFENPTDDPSGSETIIVNTRARYSTSGTNNPAASMVVRLYELTTLRGTASSDALTTSFQTFSWNLSQSIIDSVTNWDDIRVDVEVTVCEDDGADIRAQIAFIEIQFNDPRS